MKTGTLSLNNVGEKFLFIGDDEIFAEKINVFLQPQYIYLLVQFCENWNSEFE